jgi:hypothetical protein
MILWQSSKKVQGGKYSAFAIFKNPKEAHRAYETVTGSQEKVCMVDMILSTFFTTCLASASSVGFYILRTRFSVLVTADVYSCYIK